MAAPRTPSQARSRQTVDALLRSAETAFAIDGFERATVRSIAKRADVPVGSLYQFFANKEALLDAIVEQHLHAIHDIFDHVWPPTEADLASSHLEPLEWAATRAVDRIVDLAAGRPSFRSLFAGPATSGPFAAAGLRLRSAMAARTSAALTLANPGDGELYEVAAEVCTELLRGLLPRTVDENGNIDERLRPELAVAVAAYLRSVKQRSGS